MASHMIGDTSVPKRRTFSGQVTREDCVGVLCGCPFVVTDKLYPKYRGVGVTLVRPVATPNFSPGRIATIVLYTALST